MAARKSTKKTTSRTSKKTSEVATSAEPTFTLPAASALSATNKNFIILLSVAAILLVTLFFLNKDWFIAAQVNGSYVTNLELQKRLNEEYRQQALEQIINEKIILSEATAKGIEVSQDEVNQEIAELETRFEGAENLNKLLEQQGTNRQGLERQIKAQIALEKMYESEATVSQEEIDEYITQNKATLVATDEAAQRTEAEAAIKERKLYTIFSEKFQELKDKAKVTIF